MSSVLQEDKYKNKFILLQLLLLLQTTTKTTVIIIAVENILYAMLCAAVLSN